MMLLNNKEIACAFGRFIRSRRENLELTQTDIATKLGITQTHYSRIEQGGREITMTMALNICRVLDLDFNSFIASTQK